MWSGIHVGAGALLLAILAARGPLGTINTGLGGWKTLLQDASPFSIMEVLTTLTDAILLETDFANNNRNLNDFVYWIYNFGPLVLNALDLPGAMYGGVASLTLRALYLDAKEGDVILVSKEAEAKALKVKEEAAISKARAKARAQERVEADIQAAAQRSAILAAEKELDAKRRTLIAQGKPITPLHRTPSQTLILDSTPSPERPPPLSTPKTPADFGGDFTFTAKNAQVAELSAFYACHPHDLYCRLLRLWFGHPRHTRHLLSKYVLQLAATRRVKPSIIPNEPAPQVVRFLVAILRFCRRRRPHRVEYINADQLDPSGGAHNKARAKGEILSPSGGPHRTPFQLGRRAGRRTLRWRRIRSDRQRAVCEVHAARARATPSLTQGACDEGAV